ncbi:hypothetical protein PAALTS15_11930 [Paenibacillus alvei TS-15]|uniref:Uncharacterized protein n=2 Tax=Paenibacillus alvei TaxID=44250 RepID=S9SSC7_PAEAL|nr:MULTISPECIES: hypothetical protein [Paenibacillus]EPY07053.1 hypothetical protein PAALTS15_11930 [Paenibacillus alvei TS-15]EPY13579.1 hypothetical protein PAAL66ix_07133 [Paenibacillus alvei A6-6i-x]MCY9531493.1 hypothetical protein [Paenibacillus alvei]SDG40218.1 hypothetical protein SAMN04488689_11432 [Paenibacillus sp. cl6col]
MNAVKVIVALVASIVAGGAYAWVTNQWSDLVPVYPLILAGLLYLLILWVSKKKSTVISLGVLLGIVAIAANLFIGMELLKKDLQTQMTKAGSFTGSDAEIKSAVNEFLDERLMEMTGYKGIVGYTINLTSGEITTKTGRTVGDDESSPAGVVFQVAKFGIILLGPAIMGWRRKEENQEEIAGAEVSNNA